MTFETFNNFWEQCSDKWLLSASFLDENNNVRQVSDICKLKDNYVRIIYHNYTEIKNIIKRNYYHEVSYATINRYKRAAVLVYAIILTDPLKYKVPTFGKTYFLKQRFAVYVALSSILVDYDQSKVMQRLEDLKKKNPQATIFDFGSLGEFDSGRDDFLTSFYKDLEFAEIYHNYDILAIANIFGLLVDKCSIITDKMLIDAPMVAGTESLTTATNIE